MSDVAPYSISFIFFVNFLTNLCIIILQMWFAALGTYQSAPWFIHLVDKILEGSPAVLRLLGDVEYNVPPTRVRANLFHYDFTRASHLPWAKRIPGVQLVDVSQNEDSPSANTTNNDNWWYRKHVREYIPAIEKRNPSVNEFLKNQGTTLSIFRLFPAFSSFVVLIMR